MQYFDFCSEKISRLGFGLMRLPQCKDGSIDEEKTAEMVDYAIQSGVNYFDTAWFYHHGESERVAGRILSRYPRSSFHLASKFPSTEIRDSDSAKRIFETQLEKCQTDHFDFYLLHNVCESTIEPFTSKQFGILDYLLEQKAQGRIRHFGCSTHAGNDAFAQFIDTFGESLEFCQIELNYLDWTLQDAKKKCEILTEHRIPIWVMEPVRGGRLAKLPASAEALLRSLRPEDSIPAWAFRWVMGVPNVGVILSGMSNLEQMQDNIKTFSSAPAMTPEENELLLSLGDKLKDFLPCTGCRYCCDGCPMSIDIPRMISVLNEVRYDHNAAALGTLSDVDSDCLPSACVGCGQCEQICPQHIGIPAALEELATQMK